MIDEIYIIRHPASGHYYIGQPLIVVATGSSLYYQWQRYEDGAWKNILNGISAEYYPDKVGEYNYRVIISNGVMIATENSDLILTEDNREIRIEDTAVSNTAETVFEIAETEVDGDLIAYIKSNEDFSTKDIVQFSEYSIGYDIEFAEKSTIKVQNKPNIVDDDFVILKRGSKVIFFGICDDFSSDESSGYTITLKQIECLFDRTIFPGNEALISSTGIEDFIKSEIEANWTNSGDDMLDKDYITVTASTHTPIYASVNAEQGVYNLKTFIGNAKEYYGIFLDVTYTNTAMTINVRKDNTAELPIDVTVPDVSEYQETYNVDVLGKLNVKWFNTSTEATTNLAYYLKADRTITTNEDDPDRARGIVSSFYVEKETMDEVYQEVLNQFAANTYEHKISFKLFENCKAYPPSECFVGRKASIRTKTGVKTSLITKMSFSSDSTFVGFEFGKLKISLIDKIRALSK